MNWSWWSPRHVFDAQVLVCALGFRLGKRPVDRADAPPAGRAATWSGVVTGVLGVPPLPPLATDGTIGDRARCSLNFRDEYYGLVPAVSDDGDGPPLVTSGLIDPGRCRWGERPVRFAKREFAAPRVDLTRLDATHAGVGPGASSSRRCSSPTRPASSRPSPTRVERGCRACRSARSCRRATRPSGSWPPCSRRRSPRPPPGSPRRAPGCRPGRSGSDRRPWRRFPGRPATSVRALGCSATATCSGAGGPSPPPTPMARPAPPADDSLFEWWSGSVNGAAVGRRGSSAAPSPASRRSSTAAPARPTR